MVMTRESTAKALGLPIVARVVSHAAHAHEPALFTTAPVPAMQKALKKAGWSVEDVDLWEVNEAFAVVAMIAQQELGIDRAKLNVNGGATALGHPIGASGARILTTLLFEMKRSGAKKGLATLCIGGGMGTATVIERIDIDADGIATLTFDVPGRSMNTLTASVMKEIPELVERIKTDEAIKGCVLTSGKASGFCAGADLGDMASGVLSGAGDLQKAFDAGWALNGAFRALETSGKPIAAAINGLALGGGLEFTLACHYRVVEDDSRIQLGLPEIKVGLFPGGGGTQRLTRLIGVQAAMMQMSEGKSWRPNDAKGAGVVHEVVAKGQAVEAAKAWIKGGGKPVQPWDEKSFKLPGGGPYHPAGIQNFMVGNAMLRKQSYGNYPAVVNLMKAVYEGVQVPMDAALRIETRYFIKTLMTPQAQAMIRSLFLSKQELDKGAVRPAGVPKSDPKKVAVLGAGMMGAGIAYVQVMAGIETVLIDQSQEAADKGKAHVEELLKKRLSRGQMTQEKFDATLALVTATTDYDYIKGSDLVVEAVFENREIKADVTKRAEAQLAEGAVFGSNTSTLPISGLAEASVRPEDFIGIHFFSPVDKMMLVEIILGEKTGEAAIAKALDYVLKIKKTPIVVNDSRGFYTSRCFSTFLMEGMAMLEEGYGPALIDN
ncbi:hypothetical protein LTR94_025531, partial [Friedmanniomyces endolithicus]